MSGGVQVRVLRRGMTRAPVFRTPDVTATAGAYKWITKHENTILEWPEAHTGHVHLTHVWPYAVGRTLFVRFTFDCADACGCNAVTVISDKLARRLEGELSISCVALSSNLCSDKKPGAINALLGRGHYVVAGVRIDKGVLTEVLRTSAKELVEVARIKLQLGSSLAGAPYHQNAHVANTLAGIFIASGQDVAQIVESSASSVTMEDGGQGDVYASITMPSLEVGVVGGGTALPQNSETVAAVDCSPSDSNPGSAADRFAEVVASLCLAGEVSLLACLSEGTLASTTERFRETQHCTSHSVSRLPSRFEGV